MSTLSVAQYVEKHPCTNRYELIRRLQTGAIASGYMKHDEWHFDEDEAIENVKDKNGVDYTQPNIGKWVAVLLVAGALAGGLAYYVNQVVPTKAVKAYLHDPSSAKFRNVEVLGGVTYGEVNAKNLFGAYVGYKSFRCKGTVCSIR